MGIRSDSCLQVNKPFNHLQDEMNENGEMDMIELLELESLRANDDIHAGAKTSFKTQLCAAVDL